jgi:alpha-glucosidase
MLKPVALCLAFFISGSISFAQSSPVTITSPDKSIQVTCRLDAAGKPLYSV